VFCLNDLAIGTAFERPFTLSCKSPVLLMLLGRRNLYSADYY
jgi:hypothetical protein